MQTDAALPDDTRTLEHTVRTLDRDALTDRDLSEQTDDRVATPPPAREGLPKSYRSRHDRHYVEQLITATGMPLLRMLAVSRIDAANLPDRADVTALTASVARLGVLQPLLVRAQGDRFVLIAGRKRLAAAREAHLREIPCLVHTADDERAAEIAEAANASPAERRERVRQPAASDAVRAECDALSDAMLMELHDALSSVQRAVRLLPPLPGPTRERVAMRLIAAEMERAQWLVRGRRYLAGRLPINPRQLPAANLAQELRGIAAGIALHGGQFDVECSGAPATLTADSALLIATVRGLAWAMLALGETVADPRVRVTVGAPGFLTVTQPTIVLSQPVLLRFFDAGWKARPGGAATELAVQLARYTAARHDADLEVASGSPYGTSITLTLR